MHSQEESSAAEALPNTLHTERCYLERWNSELQRVQSVQSLKLKLQSPAGR